MVEIVEAPPNYHAEARMKAGEVAALVADVSTVEAVGVAADTVEIVIA